MLWAGERRSRRVIFSGWRTILLFSGKKAGMRESQFLSHELPDIGLHVVSGGGCPGWKGLSALHPDFVLENDGVIQHTRSPRRSLAAANTGPGFSVAGIPYIRLIMLLDESRPTIHIVFWKTA